MQYSLQQLVEDPTNFTEHSSSLIDLILTNDVNFVPYAWCGSPSIRSSTLPLSGHWFLECP